MIMLYTIIVFEYNPWCWLYFLLIFWKGGNCSDLLGDFKCDCQAGLTGKRCEVNVDECASHPCQNDGTCHDGLNSYYCQCNSGFTGDLCQNNINDCVGDIKCLNGGQCIDLINDYECNCTDDYYGELCELKRVNGLCATVICQNGGICREYGKNGFTCQCITGFTGSNCQTNIDECQSQPCNNGGTCIDAINDYDCTCSPGYSGKNCNYSIYSSEPQSTQPPTIGNTFSTNTCYRKNLCFITHILFVSLDDNFKLQYWFAE